LNEKLLELAKQKVPDKRLLINGASKRAAELARGARPLVPVRNRDELSYLDIALMEIVEEKITVAPIPVQLPGRSSAASV